MENLIDEFLRILCHFCDLESAYLRAFYQEDEKRLKIIDHRHQYDKQPSRTDIIRGRQISFLFPEMSGGGNFHDRDEKEDLSFPVGFPGIVTCNQPVCYQDGWVLDNLGNGKWVFRGRIHRLDTEVRIVCRRSLDGAMIQNLYAASRFMDLLEPILNIAGINVISENTDSGRTACSGQKYSIKDLDPPLFGFSPGVIKLKNQLKNIASSKIPVLIEGENGTGKEIVARNIHNLNPGRVGPLVIINCMELPPSLLQSELFGHVKGSFTGAMNNRRGLVESAGGGTFFLDEIGEMPLHLQAALLRVIQEKEIRRVGESQRRKIDVRFVFATNRDLASQVKEKRFREDLYYRIKGVRLYIPPLRQRKEDILLLARHFLDTGSSKRGRKNPQISAGAARDLLSYNWPGNVRELKNEIERAIALFPDNPLLLSEMFSSSVRNYNIDLSQGSDFEDQTLPAAVNRLELKMIEKTLKRFSGNRTRSAEMLGITRQGLLKKMKRLSLSGKDFQASGSLARDG